MFSLKKTNKRRYLQQLKLYTLRLMLKTVIFDMDGVIVDTEPLHHKAYFQMFEQVGIEVSEEQYRSYTGQSTINVCKGLVDFFKIDDSPEHLKNLKQDNFKNIFKTDKGLKLIDGVLDIIKDYHNNGLTMILASSASMNTINNVFTRFDLDQYFKTKISGADLKESKPHPEIFNKAAELSNTAKEECIVIEDSTNGIEAANRANIYCVGFRSPHSENQVYDSADLIIDSFTEISYSKIANKI